MDPPLLLDDLLPRLAENRACWPLWTYSRHPVKEWKLYESPDKVQSRSWHGCASWAERLAWSALVRTGEIHGELAESFRSWGCELEEWTPGHDYAFGVIKHETFEAEKVLAFDGAVYSFDPAALAELPVPKGQMICFDPDHFPDIGVNIPLLVHIEALSVLAQFAYRVPSSVDELEPIEFTAGLLDPWDRNEFSEGLLRTLLAPAHTGSRRDESTQFASVLRRAVRGTWKGAPSKKLRAELGGHLLRTTGLVPDRPGGRKQNIGEERLSRLYDEAISVVRTVGNEEVPHDLLKPVIELAQTDRRFSPVEIERARRTLPDGRAVSKLRQLARRLSNPFLQASEIDAITAPDREETDHELARKLIMDRLPRYDSGKHDRSFETLLSGIRSTTPKETPPE